jgi:pimeloyl-ACP methyl ester carboxylesterase
MTWGAACLEGQKSLAGGYRLLVVDRRGYGSSPDIDRSDYDVDASDVIELLGEGAHLVGHSYGGVVAMFAAGRRPEAARSLALTEPAAFRIAVEDPKVAAARAYRRPDRRQPRRCRAAWSSSCCAAMTPMRSSWTEQSAAPTLDARTIS